MYVAPLAPSLPIYDQLVHLPLFDTFVGADDITVDKDYKHIFKQLRNALLCDKGCIVRGIKLMHGLIHKHLQDSGLSNTHINHVLDPTDKQDVVLAYNLLKDLWCLPTANPEQSTQPYIELEHLSTAVHLILALYIHGNAKTLFIPSALFVDIGIMSLFGILRTMIGNDRNLDILQLALRVTATMEVSNILAKHPEWDKSPRRLCLPTVFKNMEDLSSSADHTGPSTYQHPEMLYPSRLTLATPWKHGRLSLEDKYPWIMAVLHHISTNQTTSILTPFGSSLITNCLTDEDNDTEMEEHASSSQLDGSLVVPELHDTTMGMQELEDAAAEAQWRNSPSYGQASSTDRLRRVAQESCFKPTGTGGLHQQNAESRQGLGLFYLILSWLKGDLKWT
ncbi:hypothetical protein DFH94DRAFT_826025 [Russula ochroleuca]|uniref:Uncharacterized protein n=1 Tax=Russula ochroleuca TaxID=152965 RepID=A0A9P5MYG0_9AGAM|nr:hypothetical protein DFH94DRAFT_826025 [Russula ochroleuca]